MKKPNSNPKLLLTPEQEKRARELFKLGHTRDEVAWMLAIPVSILAYRLKDQLADVRIGRGGRWRCGSADPSPEEIEQRKAEVHAMRLERFNRLNPEE